ncbi:flagellin [Oceaniglobus indicus]|uniref:flagellin n=1 Tax=Oceaniglobus indicus TaxID=2047749 RepID=UPI000C195589|nr:flagellin [Oceaniglobus indicus]
MMTSIGDLAMSFSNRLSNARIRGDLNTLAQELTTGRKSDLRSALAGDIGPVSVLERTLSNLAGYDTAATEAAMFASGAQSALTHMSAHLEDLSTAAFALDASSDTALLRSFGKDASSRFDAIVGALNTSVAGRSVFGGSATDNPPIAATSVMLDDLIAALPATPTAQDVIDTVTDYFGAGGGFETTRYLGSDVPIADFRVAPGESAAFDLDARAASLRHAMGVAAMGALIDRGALSDRPDEQSALVSHIAEDSLSASGGITILRADVGTLEHRIETARTRNASERAATNFALYELVAADPYDTATDLQAVQTQLETFFSVTARLSQLTLSGYLR